MSNINLIIAERATHIGSFMVGRLLPFRQKRMVGPFIYIDHMGPVKMSERDNFDVLPHPHIGLSTLTFLLEGSILHRDSIGTVREIRPGEVNWMTAGKGIVHSERTPDYLRHSEKQLHGLQIWVALPRELEEMNPSFAHAAAEELPAWQEGPVYGKLIAGQAFGHHSPVPVYSPLYLVQLQTATAYQLDIGHHLYGETGLYILQGGVQVEGNHFGPRQMLVATNSRLCSFTMEADTILYLFGGEPLPEERFIDWNFVSSSKERIRTAKEKWEAQAFDRIPGDDTTFVPYPKPIQQ
ncbi:MAG TPA: pirin family protein [Sediminibacterium sp.]|nr:pirin family protein [Sediminibacterium sp.]